MGNRHLFRHPSRRGEDAAPQESRLKRVSTLPENVLQHYALSRSGAKGEM